MSGFSPLLAPAFLTVIFANSSQFTSRNALEADGHRGSDLVYRRSTRAMLAPAVTAAKATAAAAIAVTVIAAAAVAATAAAVVMVIGT